mmetsp:Transcript_24302/g.52073  ORF Transcript_24302/g.52073 Transcript_24302/m.52073 type:complete len:245 (-) Transcript_24302:633-1367(-)
MHTPDTLPQSQSFVLPPPSLQKLPSAALQCRLFLPPAPRQDRLLPHLVLEPMRGQGELVAQAKQPQGQEHHAEHDVSRHGHGPEHLPVDESETVGEEVDAREQADEEAEPDKAFGEGPLDCHPCCGGRVRLGLCASLGSRGFVRPAVLCDNGGSSAAHQLEPGFGRDAVKDNEHDAEQRHGLEGVDPQEHALRRHRDHLEHPPPRAVPVGRVFIPGGLGPVFEVEIFCHPGGGVGHSHREEAGQ